MTGEACRFCADADAPEEQIFETKLFRVLVAKHALTRGHVVLVPKEHDPHFYSFDEDQMEEFGYLLKKVSFWAMRYARANGFSTYFSDGTDDMALYNHLQIHIMPRVFGDPNWDNVGEALREMVDTLSDEELKTAVNDLAVMFQMPTKEES